MERPHKVPNRLVIDHTLTNRQKTMGEIGTRNPPYLAILLTPTVWIAMFSDFANSIASYIVIIEGPNFFKNILQADISKVLILLASFSLTEDNFILTQKTKQKVLCPFFENSR